MERTTNNFSFSAILKKMPSVYIENTLNGENSIKIEEISVNNRKNMRQLLDPLFISQIVLNKPKNRLKLQYCPFKS